MGALIRVLPRLAHAHTPACSCPLRLEERCRDLKRGLDERDARWHEVLLSRLTPLLPGSHVEAAKDASLVLKPHLKPRMSRCQRLGAFAFGGESEKSGKDLKGCLLAYVRSPRGKENVELQRQLEAWSWLGLGVL